MIVTAGQGTTGIKWGKAMDVAKQCTGQPPTRKIIQSQMSAAIRLRNPGDDSTFHPASKIQMSPPQHQYFTLKMDHACFISFGLEPPVFHAHTSNFYSSPGKMIPYHCPLRSMSFWRPGDVFPDLPLIHHRRHHRPQQQ